MHFHRKKLPSDAPAYSTLLAGHTPLDETGFKTDKLQIWYNNTSELWRDHTSHAHMESDECFIILKGNLPFEVYDERIDIGSREVCFFPIGMYHAIVEVHPPVECFVIRTPSVNDKIYREE